MKKSWRTEYFRITIIYIIVTMLVPTLIILVCNFVIICGTYKTNQSLKFTTRKKLSIFQNKFFTTNDSPKKTLARNKKLAQLPKPSVKRKVSFVFKKHYLSTNKIVSKISGKTNSSKKLTKMLLFLSFSYVMLNLPYLISWLVFYYHIAFKDADSTLKNYLFAFVQLGEICYVLNYGLLFYLYSASGSIFKNRVNKFTNEYHI